MRAVTAPVASDRICRRAHGLAGECIGDAPIGCVPLSARGFAGQREVPCHRRRGVRRDPVRDRLDDEGSVVPHRHVPDARQDPELRIRDLSLEALRAGREREDPIELPPSDERRRGDLIEVLDVSTTGAETRQDIVDDSATERIETQVDSVRRGDQLAVAHDVPHRELARAAGA